MPSVQTLRARIGKKGPEPFWHRLARRFSIYLTWALLHTPVTANGVTALFLIAGIAGGLVFTGGSREAWIAGTLLTWLSIIFDFSDGEVARFRGESSWFGDYFEESVHALLLIAFYGGIALGVWRTQPENPWPFVAALAAAGFTMIIRNDKNQLLKSKFQYYGIERMRELMPTFAADEFAVTRNMGRLLYVIDMILFDMGFYFVVLPIAALTDQMALLLYFSGLSRLAAASYLIWQSWLAHRRDQQAARTTAATNRRESEKVQQK